MVNELLPGSEKAEKKMLREHARHSLSVMAGTSPGVTATDARTRENHPFKNSPAL